MRKLIIAATAAALMGLAAPAFAGQGPAGTSETNNQVSCGTNDADDQTLPNGAQVKTVGDQNAPQSGGALVVCNEGTGAPIQGRIIATGGTGGGWVAADGDATNQAEAQGYTRVDVSQAAITGLASQQSPVRRGCVLTGDTDSANPTPDPTCPAS